MKAIDFDYRRLENELSYVNEIDYQKMLSKDDNLKEIIEGKKVPSFNEIVNICNYLGIAIDDLEKQKIKKPTEIIAEANKTIIGNEELKKDLAVTLYNHQLLVNGLGGDKQVHLVVGASGTGKSFTIKKMLKLYDIDYICLDGSNITSSGYKGTNLGESLLELLPEEGFNGFVIIDEIDKMVDKDWIVRSGKSVYSELLALVENDKYVIKNNCINLSNVSFIFMGSFEHCVERKHHKTSMSLMDKVESNNYSISRDEIVKNGGLDIELVGRINKISCTDKLSKDNIINIIKTSNDSKYSQLKSFLKSYYFINFIISDQVIEYMADKAINSMYGARTINQILSNIETDIILKCEEENIEEIKLVLNEDKIELEIKEKLNQDNTECLIIYNDEYLEITKDKRMDLHKVIRNVVFKLQREYDLNIDLKDTIHLIFSEFKKQNHLFSEYFKIKYVQVQCLSEVILNNIDIYCEEDNEQLINKINKYINENWKGVSHEY